MLIHSGHHLTYCSNIHPGEDWSSVFRNLQTYIPPLKQQLAANQPFGIGLRLANVASQELLSGEALTQLQDWLRANDCYVFTLNGFPYGGFHHQIVKDQVYAPDWSKRDRLTYTQRLIQILGVLLPDGMDGGISTVPLSYKPWWGGQSLRPIFEQSTHYLAQLAVEMAIIRDETGRVLHLDLEPEPDAMLENTPDVLAYFRDWLWPHGQTFIQQHYGKSALEAEEILRTHIRLCYDTCHFAVEYEDPLTALKQFQAEGIEIGKVQLSSALRILIPAEDFQRKELIKHLEAFAESTYLHQVIAQHQSKPDLMHYEDLTDALPALIETSAQEWRTHFHIPIFMDRYPPFVSTQDHITEILQHLPQWSDCQHLEIETYTWEVLPPDLKQDIRESIQREYEWVLDQVSSAEKT